MCYHIAASKHDNSTIHRLIKKPRITFEQKWHRNNSNLMRGKMSQRVRDDGTGRRVESMRDLVKRRPPLAAEPPWRLTAFNESEDRCHRLLINSICDEVNCLQIEMERFCLERALRGLEDNRKKMLYFRFIRTWGAWDKFVDLTKYARNLNEVCVYNMEDNDLIYIGRIA